MYAAFKAVTNCRKQKHCQKVLQPSKYIPKCITATFYHSASILNLQRWGVETQILLYSFLFCLEKDDLTIPIELNCE